MNRRKKSITTLGIIAGLILCSTNTTLPLDGLKRIFVTTASGTVVGAAAGGGYGAGVGAAAGFGFGVLTELFDKNKDKKKKEASEESTTDDSQSD